MSKNILLKGRIKGKLVIRRIVQATSIFIFFFLFYKTTVFPIPEKLPLSIYFKIDGLLAISMAIISKSFSLLFPAIFLLLLIMIFGNFFCTWICPVGGIIDYLCTFLFRKYWKISPVVRGFIRNMGIFTFTFVIASAVFASFFHYPFLGFIFDPFVIINNAFIGLKIWIILFACIIVASILKPRIWCYCICPLGWFYTLVGTRLRIKKIISNIRKNIRENL